MKETILSQAESADFTAPKPHIGDILAQGAEAVLILRGGQVLKRRVVKGYRLKELDERIRKLRTRSEAKLLEKSGKIICVPKVLKMDEKSTEIDMEFIEGKKLSEELDFMKNWREVCFAIGENIAKLHDAGIIHGDLTTSNMIWVNSKKGTGGAQFGRANSRNALLINGDSLRSSMRTEKISGQLYFIDFGLGFQNGQTEDKAVDLYLIKDALEAKHFKRFDEYFSAVIEGYTSTSKHAGEVLKRLKAVEKRGRYKAQY